MAQHHPIQSVVTTLQIVEHMARTDGPAGISEIARTIGTPRPRVHRHLRTLVDQGYAVQDPLNDKYYLTLKFFHIGQAIADQTDFLALARRMLPTLRDRVEQTVTIGQIEADGVRILDILRHRSAVEISTRPGALFDFHCTAQGKVALAYGQRSLWQSLQQRPLRKWTKSTIVNKRQLKAEVDRVRLAGWATAPEQTLTGVNAVAAPVFDRNGALAGTITILGSVQFVAPQPSTALITALLDAAQELSDRLGFKAAVA